MNFFSRIATVFFVLIVFCQIARADTIVPSDRVTNFVNVRAEASRDSEVRGKLQPGDSAEYLDSVPHWYSVKLSTGNKGYVHKSWTRRITATTSTQNLEVHFIYVGQGDSTLVICPNGENILVDAGSTDGGSADDVRDYILDIIDKKERRINTLVITHPDSDHYNFIDDVLHKVPVDHMYMVGDIEHDYYDNFETWYNKQTDIKTSILNKSYYNAKDNPNSEIDCGSASVYILAAAIESDFSTKNTKSIVMMIRYGDFEVILTGDATKKTEVAILNRYDHSWLDSDVLKIGHHGSSYTSTTDSWASVIKPKTAVASAVYDSTHGHPRKEVIERLDDFTEDNDSAHLMVSSTGRRNHYVWHEDSSYTESIYSTAVNGHVVVTSDGSGFDIETSGFEE